MNLVKKVRNLVRHLLIGHLTYEHLHLEEKLLENKLMIGTLHARILKNEHFKNIQDAEFKVFSQFGEDGIIQYLINNLSLKSKTFVEIGSGDYSESNTRFLLEHNSWKGVIIDKEKDVLDFVQKGKGKYLTACSRESPSHFEVTRFEFSGLKPHVFFGDEKLQTGFAVCVS